MNKVVLQWNRLICFFWADVETEQLNNYFISLKSLLGKGTFQVLDISEKSDCCLTIIYHNSDEKNVNFNQDIVTIYYPWMEAINNNVFECILLLAYLRMQYQAKTAIIHASSVLYKKKAIVFLGPKESGKTSVAINMCRIYGAKLLSNDYTNITIGENGIWLQGGDGKETITFRSHALRNIDKEVLFNHIPTYTGGERIKIDNKEMGIECSLKKTLVDKFVFVGVGQSKHLTVDNTIRIKTKVDLYSNFTELIKCVSLLLFSSKKRMGAYIPEVFNKDMHLNIHEMISYISDNNMVEEVRGPMNEIVQYFGCTINL